MSRRLNRHGLLRRYLARVLLRVRHSLTRPFKAGAVAVMALERVPADIRAQGGVARMVSTPCYGRSCTYRPQSDPAMIKKIVEAVTIPVMAKARIGHFVEAQILQAVGVDYIDESEVLTPADDQVCQIHFWRPQLHSLRHPQHHINKHAFKVPSNNARVDHVVEAQYRCPLCVDAGTSARRSGVSQKAPR